MRLIIRDHLGYQKNKIYTYLILAKVLFIIEL